MRDVMNPMLGSNATTLYDPARNNLTNSLGPWKAAMNPGGRHPPGEASFPPVSGVPLAASLAWQKALR